MEGTANASVLCSQRRMLASSRCGEFVLHLCRACRSCSLDTPALPPSSCCACFRAVFLLSTIGLCLIMTFLAVYPKYYRATLMTRYKKTNASERHLREFDRRAHGQGHAHPARPPGQQQQQQVPFTGSNPMYPQQQQQQRQLQQQQQGRPMRMVPGVAPQARPVQPLRAPAGAVAAGRRVVRSAGPVRQQGAAPQQVPRAGRLAQTRM